MADMNGIKLEPKNLNPVCNENNKKDCPKGDDDTQKAIEKISAEAAKVKDITSAMSALGAISGYLTHQNDVVKKVAATAMVEIIHKVSGVLLGDDTIGSEKSFPQEGGDPRKVISTIGKLLEFIDKISNSGVELPGGSQKKLAESIQNIIKALEELVKPRRMEKDSFLNLEDSNDVEKTNKNDDENNPFKERRDELLDSFKNLLGIGDRSDRKNVDKFVRS